MWFKYQELLVASPSQDIVTYLQKTGLMIAIQAIAEAADKRASEAKAAADKKAAEVKAAADKKAAEAEKLAAEVSFNFFSVHSIQNSILCTILSWVMCRKD
jgi:DNA-binding GntR family transcriptional regulator